MKDKITETNLFFIFSKIKGQNINNPKVTTKESWNPISVIIFGENNKSKNATKNKRAIVLAFLFIIFPNKISKSIKVALKTGAPNPVIQV